MFDSIQKLGQNPKSFKRAVCLILFCSIGLAQSALAHPLSKVTRKSSGKDALALMLSFARQPDLLDASYLRRVLGAPDDRGRYILGGRVLHYSKKVEPGTSYDFSANQIYAATTYSATSGAGGGVAGVGGAPGGATTGSVAARNLIGACENRQLVCHLEQSGLTLSQVRSTLGAPERRYFDSQSHPVDVYRYNPYASISITEPVNSFNVSEITVNYIGDPLPGPAPESMMVADNCRIAKAKALLAAGLCGPAVELVREHLEDNPRDGRMHLIYAGILRRTSDLNGALSEYRTALDIARESGDKELETASIKWLSTFGVVQVASKQIQQSQAQPF